MASSSIWEDTALLKGPVGIVTGRGRGIRRATARKFATEGVAIIVAARSEGEVQQVAPEIQGVGGRAAAVAADASREADCERIISMAHDVFGAIHILVNNAGVLGPERQSQEITPQEWDEVIAVNPRGPFLLSRLVLPEM